MKNSITTCAITILMPFTFGLVSAWIPNANMIVNNGLDLKANAKTSTSLNFHNPNMDHLDSQGPRISIGNRYRTVPKPYYDSGSAFQHQPARPFSSTPFSPTSAAAAVARTNSEYSDYGTQNVYWNDINGFPQENVIDPETMPSMQDMQDMRNGGVMGGGNVGNANGRVYSTDKYYQNNDPNNQYPPSSSSAPASRFQDIPFQSNENYAKKFYNNAQREEGRNIYGNNMNGNFDNRPMDRPYGRDMMGGQQQGPRGHYSNDGGNMPPGGMQENDFPSLMNEIMPPPGGMGSMMMEDPYYGGGYGGQGYGQDSMPYGGMGGGGMMMEPGMYNTNMPPGGQGEWGFQEMGMGPGGECWEHQEFGFGAPPPMGGGFGQEGPMMQGGPFGGGEPFQGGGGGPGGFW